MRAKRGFTLIEILVVILIVGITLGFALLAFGDFGASRRILVSAEQFSSYLQLVQQKAILEVNTLGININSKGYQTYRFTQKTWKPLSESLFRMKYFPKDMIVILQGNLKNHSNKPDIIINSSGDMTEFKLIFGNEKQRDIATLTGKHNGQLTMQQPST